MQIGKIITQLGITKSRADYILIHRLISNIEYYTGTGSRRHYTDVNTHEFKVISSLVDAGISINQIVKIKKQITESFQKPLRFKIGRWFIETDEL